ncbi:MAG: hypothetical protein DWQ05_03285 [Calditrichaeota bacterium]|nr:MAG: hypothetical protein DWQ05_03285 [Calditrichota bacterium]
MSGFYRFSVKVVLYSSLFLAIIAYPIWHLLGTVSLWSVLSGSLVGAFNIILAHIFNHRALEKSTDKIMKSMLMGMAVRLIVVAASTIIVVKLTELKIIEFLVALLMYYFFLQWFEVRFIQQNILLSGKQK